MNAHEKSLDNVPLGQHSDYPEAYDAGLLFPIPRQLKRDELAIVAESLPFDGVDVWTAYELSFLNAKGKPLVFIAEFLVPATSPNIIESKSFKLYLNSFNAQKFADVDVVTALMCADLSKVAGGVVSVKLMPLNDAPAMGILPGQCLDGLDIDIDNYQLDNRSLKADANGAVISETVHSHLLKSNCLVTGQPDWGSVCIEYTGHAINHAGLLRYLISFRSHMEFHEQCVERIFSDIQRLCAPQSLSVYARYVRRGGLDINPYRTNSGKQPDMPRLVRQ